MSIRILKDKLYDILVVKNDVIRQEYQGYVEKYRELHEKQRLNSWILLFKLNVKYRILKKNISNSKIGENKINTRRDNRRYAYLEGAESSISKRQNPLYLAKGLLRYDVISFDIFDTLILRRISDPKDVFILVGEKLKCMDFRRIRIESEREVRELAKIKKGNYEVTLEEIYEVIQKKTGIDKRLGMEAEIQSELEVCIANPYMQRVFKILRDQKKEIILVSDMYLSHQMIERLLSKCGYSGYSKLYVSCEYNANKRHGGLYQVVLNDIARGKKIVHIGDNIETDINSAKRQGIDARYYKNVHEIGKDFRPDGMSTLIGSIHSGIINTHLHNGIKVYSPQYEYGFTYGALYILGYCNWLYQEAKKNNIEKILFLSRDGDIYQKVFNEMFQDMPNEYVYWSRISNIKYANNFQREDVIAKIVKHRVQAVNKITVGKLLTDFRLEELERYLTEYGLSRENIVVNENAKMIASLLNNHWNVLVESYAMQRNLLRTLFEDIIGDCKKVAVVDVGWIGTGPLGIKQLIEDEWKLDCNVECYVAVYRHWSEGAIDGMMLNEAVKPYLFSKTYNRCHYDNHTKTNKGMNNIYFEFFTQACSPSFAGIDDVGNYKFDIPEVENYQYIKEIQEGILDYVRIYKELSKDSKYILRISGYDAYCAFRMIIRDCSFIHKYFGDFKYSRAIVGDTDNQNIESLTDILENI